MGGGGGVGFGTVTERKTAIILGEQSPNSSFPLQMEAGTVK